MKMYSLLLWLLVLLVALQACIALQTCSEFYTLPHGVFLKQLDDIGKSTDYSKVVRNIQFQGYLNGQYGRYLAYSTLIIDAVVLLLLGVAIKKIPRPPVKGKHNAGVCSIDTSSGGH